MRMTRIALALTLSAAGFAYAEDDKQQEGKSSASMSASSDASASSADAKILAKLHETNQMEVEFGKLAQQKGSSAEVKAFGKQLVQDHQSADKKIMALAKEQSISISSSAGPMDSTDAKKTADQKAALERLKTMSGSQFDQEFLKTMAEGHEHALDLVKQNKGSVRDSKVKSLLSELEPVLQKHQQMAESGGHDHEKSGKAKTSTQ